MSKRNTVTNDEREQAISRLRELCPPGTTVYTIMRHRSRSGTSRVVDPIVFTTERALRNLAWCAGKRFPHFDRLRSDGGSAEYLDAAKSAIDLPERYIRHDVHLVLGCRLDREHERGAHRRVRV